MTAQNPATTMHIDDLRKGIARRLNKVGQEDYPFFYLDREGVTLETLVTNLDLSREVHDKFLLESFAKEKAAMIADGTYTNDDSVIDSLCFG